MLDILNTYYMKRHPWHAASVEETAKLQATHLSEGLSNEEATRRAALGTNKLPAPKPESILVQIFRQLQSPIALVLLIAAGITLAISHFTDALVITAALVVNVIIGVYQEGRASRAFAALAKSEAAHALVVRDGKREEVLTEEVVLGDLIHLMPGMKVPADARVVVSHDLELDESALTGEWIPTEKYVATVGEDVPLAERHSMIYAGTLVSSGSGDAIVVAIGAETEFGGIARELGQGAKTETPLQRDMRELSRLLLIVIGVVSVIIAGLALWRGLSLIDTLLIAIAVAVAAIPEGLPAAVTVVLALGMERILKQGGLVRNLLGAETLGATSIILTDKTGTLTEGKMEAVGFVTLGHTTEDVQGPRAHDMLRAAVLASDGFTEEVDAPSTGSDAIVVRGRPMDQAIIRAGLEAGISEVALRAVFPRKDELAFSSERRFAGMLVSEEGKTTAYLSGAPELFLDGADLTDDERTFFKEALGRATMEGKRVLAVGYRPYEGDKFPEDAFVMELIDGVELLGFIVFSDVIRKDARASIAEIKKAGAHVIMLTGDNPETALWFAREVGIAEEGARAVTGKEIREVSDEDLLLMLRTEQVFARVAPEDKLRIARVLSNAHEVVAMTGDGVNDAPALEAAAIGVALGSGTDVAKEAADIVLLTDSFSVITKAIEEGRRLRDNIKKLFTYMLSTNMSEIVVIGTALTLGLPLPVLPSQIMWSNLIEGGLMNIALAFEPLYPSAMRRSPKHPDVAKVVSKDVLKMVAFVGGMGGLLLIVLQLWLVYTGVPEKELRTLIFASLSISTMASAFSFKSFGTPLWKLDPRSNPLLLVGLFLGFGMLAVALYFPPIAMLVHTIPLPPQDLLILFVFALGNIAIVEIAKELIVIGPERRRNRQAK